MTVSYILIFLLVIVLIVSLFSSYNHIFKSTITSFLSLVIVVSLVYIDYSFNSLKIVNDLASKISNFLGFLVTDYNVQNIDMVSEGMLYLISYLVIYLIIYIIMKFCVSIKITPARLSARFSVLFLRLLNLAVVGFIVVFFVSYLSPVVRLDDGFLTNVLEMFRWRVTLL